MRCDCLIRISKLSTNRREKCQNHRDLSDFATGSSHRNLCLFCQGIQGIPPGKPKPLRKWVSLHCNLRPSFLKKVLKKHNACRDTKLRRYHAPSPVLDHSNPSLFLIAKCVQGHYQREIHKKLGKRKLAPWVPFQTCVLPTPCH